MRLIIIIMMLEKWESGALFLMRNGYTLHTRHNNIIIVVELMADQVKIRREEHRTAIHRQLVQAPSNLFNRKRNERTNTFPNNFHVHFRTCASSFTTSVSICPIAIYSFVGRPASCVAYASSVIMPFP